MPRLRRCGHGRCPKLLPRAPWYQEQAGSDLARGARAWTLRRARRLLAFFLSFKDSNAQPSGINNQLFDTRLHSLWAGEVFDARMLTRCGIVKARGNAILSVVSPASDNDFNLFINSSYSLRSSSGSVVGLRSITLLKFRTGRLFGRTTCYPTNNSNKIAL